MGIGLIAGTGLDFLSPKERWSEVPTPYGPAYLAAAVLGGRQVVLLRRHGPASNIPPHLINYHANLWALREAGVRRVLATAAVGSLKKEVQPGSLAVVCDFIDFTRRRQTTAFDRPGAAVAHVDFSTPYCPEISGAFEQAASESGIALGRRVTYVCVDGPRYETPAEVGMFAKWGGDVVGMTGVPEAVLAREMGMCYGALAIVTNYAAGILDRPISHQDVLKCVADCRRQVQNILERAAAKLSKTCACCRAMDDESTASAR